MPSSCEFRLNRPNGVYFSGQSVTGSIVLNTTKEKHIKNICIRFLGEAKVHWTEIKKRRKFIGISAPHTDFYRGDKVYVDKAATVRGGGILPPGAHTFKFSFRVPKSCPTSCEAKHGHLRYVLWLTVDRQFHSNNEFSKPLTILQRVDLNLNPSFKVPLKAETASSLGCWPCASGKILYTLCVPYGAYACGQTLQYSLEIHNQSMTEVCGYKAEFAEYMTFIAHTPDYKERKKRTVITRRDHYDSCLRLSNRRYDGSLVLPALPPDTGGNVIIRVKHSLEIEIFIGGCHNGSFVSVPIFIGNIPIRGTAQARGQAAPSPPVARGQAPPPPPPAASANPIVEAVASEVTTHLTTLEPTSAEEESDMDEPPAYGDLQPPSFEEAINITTSSPDHPDGTEHNHVIRFIPLYPIYPETK